MTVHGSDLGGRLRRLLFVVPYVQRNPGVTVPKLAREVGVDVETLLADIDSLNYVGCPPFAPHEMVELHMEGERVYVDLAQRLTRPPRLSALEALALVAAAKPLAETDDSAVASAIGKVKNALPESAKPLLDALTKRIAVSPGETTTPGLIRMLKDACSRRQELSLEYLSMGKDVPTERLIEPAALVRHQGRWYLYARTVPGGEERIFRADRMRRARPTGKQFPPRPPPPEDFFRRPTMFLGKPREVARIRFSKDVARYVRERFPPDEVVESAKDGSVIVNLPYAGEAFAVAYALSWGGEAEILEPAPLRAAFRKACQKALAMYDKG